MNRIKLLLLLYNDYSNTSLGNDVTKVKALSSLILLEAYPYLLNADRSEYEEGTYNTAIAFFQEQNMEENMIQLYKRISDNILLCDKSWTTHNLWYILYTRSLSLFSFDRANTALEKDTSTVCKYNCALFYGDCAVKAYKRQYYYLAIWSGHKS